MRRVVKMGAWLLLPFFAAGCPAPSPQPDGGTPATNTACLSQPGLMRAPAGQLPCELLPPGFKK